jgi:hypothetical protein
LAALAAGQGWIFAGVLDMFTLINGGSAPGATQREGAIKV